MSRASTIHRKVPGTAPLDVFMEGGKTWARIPHTCVNTPSNWRGNEREYQLGKSSHEPIDCLGGHLPWRSYPLATFCTVEGVDFEIARPPYDIIIIPKLPLLTLSKFRMISSEVDTYRRE